MKDYDRHKGLPEKDRLEAVEIIERHFPEISPDNVYRLTVSLSHENGYATVNVYRYAPDGLGYKYLDEKTGEVAVLPVVTKRFPESGLLAP